MATISFTVNGQAVTGQCEDRTLLVDFLRDTLRLTGTHIGCDTSQCGCCTIHMNGTAVKSCTLLAVQVNGASLTTIEGLATKGSDGAVTLHPMQQAFSDCHGLQCGFCTPGMIMASLEIVKHCPTPTDADIHHGLEGNLCRCTGYVNIVKAVHEGAARMRG
jgi:aerobic carbon-monoxide dehydrogenase small subunit